MVRRKYNFSAKKKRYRYLALAILLSLVLPIHAFISKWLSQGMNRFEILHFTATQHSFIWMGIMLVTGTILHEVGKKHKPPAARDTLLTLCCMYILCGVLLYAQMPELNTEITEHLVRSTQLIAYFYLTGLAISVGAIWAGTS